MLYSIFFHLQRFYSFNHSGAGIPTGKTVSLVCICTLLLTLATAASALAHLSIGTQLSLANTDLASAMTDSLARHLFAGAMMAFFCNAQRLFCFASLLAAFNLVLLAAALLIGYVGLQVCLAIVCTFAIWSIVAAYRFKPRLQAGNSQNQYVRRGS